jgi:hypothetical protein
MMDRDTLLHFHRKIPRPKVVWVYRMDEETVVEKIEVPFAQVRLMSRQEVVAQFGPSVTKAREINLFVAELNGFEPREYDRIECEGEWWYIASHNLEAMDTRYRCNCLESSEVVE